MTLRSPKPVVATLSLALLSGAALGAPPPRSGIGYAQATGYYKQESRPTLYQPLNLLDGRDPTAWCSPTSDPLGEFITVGFNGPVRVDELHISTGNNFDEHTWSTFARAKKLVIKSGKQSQTVELEDARGPQTVTLKTPMTGARFQLEVLDQYPAEEPDQPVCLTDLVFVSDGKPLNGPWLTTRLKYDRGQSSVMGTWYAGYPGTPDRFLSFNFGGGLRYSFEPYDATRATPKVVEGTYDVSGARLTLDLAGRRTVLKVTKTPVEGAGEGSTGKVMQLTLEGDVPEDLKGPWRSAP